MPLRYINEMLGLLDLQLDNILSLNVTEVHLEGSPVVHKHPAQCPTSKTECIGPPVW